MNMNLTQSTLFPLVTAGLCLALSACTPSEPSGDASVKPNDSSTSRSATAEEIAAYPLNTCVVSGEPLGSMGDTIDIFYQNQLVRLCCSHCIDSFHEEPQKFITKITQSSNPSTSLDK
ncbi:MAG: hypothetical protein LR011_02935 [Verrucomicrobia bacterium]|nr:hypothetical protein [Verrucomicrobiota bacterium]